MRTIISVVIPCYNLEAYISKSINSIINQTYKDIEIILINDGSIDGTKRVCEEFEKKYTNIKVVCQPNSGVSVARNNGYSISKGEYICFLDGDDFLEKNCFEEVIKKFKKNPAIDMCFYGFKDVSEKGEVSFEYDKTRIYPENVLESSEAFLLKCMRKIWICTGSCVYRKSFLDKYKIKYKNGYKYGEDVNFINTCLSYAREVDFVKENFLGCLTRSGSATRSGMNASYIDSAKLNRILYDEIRSRTDLNEKDREIMLIGCDIDYIHVITASGKNIVDNLGWFSTKEAKRLYKEFNIKPQKINIDNVKPYISNAKLLEWRLFCKWKTLFFYMTKIYRAIKE